MNCGTPDANRKANLRRLETGGNSGGFLMNITLARIDDRLIHGQVTTVWSKVANAQRIIICNDEVYNDEVRRTLLRQAAPPGMKVNVVNIEKKPSRFITTRNIRTKPFFIFHSPTGCLSNGSPG